MRDLNTHAAQDMERADSDSMMDQSCAAAVGFFDGIHRGHEAVIRRLINVAQEASLPTAVVLLVPADHFFIKNPDVSTQQYSDMDAEDNEIIDAGSKEVMETGNVEEAEAEERILPPQTTQINRNGIGRLCTIEDCTEMILAFGVDIILTMPWNESSPYRLQESANNDGSFCCNNCDHHLNDKMRALLEQIGVKILVTGNPRQSELEGIRTVGVETVDRDGFPVTTDRILKALQCGKIEEVNDLLGRAHHYCGRVIPGARRGRAVGMPTANMNVSSELQLPAFGVYGTRIRVRNRWYKSLTNIGNRPTVDASGKVTIETHILDFDDAIYVEEVKLEILTYIRPTVKFESIIDVRDQVKRDIDLASMWFEQYSNR
jgi:riboflavin kinase/FMN adenylyltransferase